MLSNEGPYFNSNWRIIGQLSIIIIILSLPLYILINQPWKNQTISTKAQFVGKESCIECHKTEYKQWIGSDHDKAMAIASDSSVLGNFDDFKFIHNGQTHHFFKKNSQFYVNTIGANGTFEDFKITHTFGHKPLQQYLVPFENGKYQCLPIAWDTDKNKWFHLGDTLYPEENLNGENWLFWTNQAQNWNGMCADCHSTNLQKNYNQDSNSYNTTFSEINVSCEACHGPASEHIKWASLPINSRPKDNNTGLVIKTSNINNVQFVNTCARCHSRRNVLCDFQNQTTELLDHIIPAKPVMPNYYHDGQIMNEDYVYSSFTQSKMYTKNVGCNDCHNSHSLKLKSRKNDLCLQCHQPVIYDTPDHHFHKMPGDNYDKLANNTGKPNYEEGEGARCINCHMTGDHYMGNDYRRDHSFRIPRPDISIEIKTPNACTNCHNDKDAQWAQSYIKKWYGEKKRPHYGTTFESASRGDTSALTTLIKYAENEVYPIMIRAAAITFLQNYSDSLNKRALQTLITDPESIIRNTALDSYHSNNIDELIKYVYPLLNDNVKAIRANAAYHLSTIPKEHLNDNQIQNINKGLEEYKTTNEYMADFPGAQYNLGNMHLNQNNIPKAIKHFQNSLKIDNKFQLAKANLAYVYNMQGKNNDAEKLYLELISENPDMHEFYYSYALLLAEMGKLTQSRNYLLKTIKYNNNDTRAWYNLALIESNLNNLEDAEKYYLKTVELAPKNFEYLWAISIHYINTNNSEKAKQYINKMDSFFPNNPNVYQLKKSITK